MQLKKCECCDEVKHDIERRRQSTAYAEDESNFVTCCLECFNVREDYWSERWSDYYAGLLW